MSEREFEIYLKLLGDMLKLSASQRGEIADELKTHLDERLNDLIEEGHSRDQAIQICLDDFGDAAGLAAHFTHLAHLRRRRRIMRWTTGTVAVMTACVLTLAHFWPADNGPIQLTQSSIAEDPFASLKSDPDPFGSSGDEAAASDSKPEKPGSEKPKNSEEIIKAKLEQPLDGIEFVDIPLKEVLDYVSHNLQVDILVNEAALSETGMDLSMGINLSLSYGKISTETLFELLFEQLQLQDELTLVVRDEILYLTEISHSMTVEVYDCRALLVSKPNAAEEAMHGGAAPMGVQFGGGLGGGGEGGGMMGEMGMGGGQFIDPGSRPALSPGQQLIQVVKNIVSPESWIDNGGQGSIEEFNGLLIVKTTERTHEEVRDLLDKLSETLNPGHFVGSL